MTTRQFLKADTVFFHVCINNVLKKYYLYYLLISFFIPKNVDTS